MNRFLVIPWMCLLPLTCLQAQEPAAPTPEKAKEMQQLQADLAKLQISYESDLTIARNRQIERLQTLLKAVTQRGDLEGAVTVRDQISALKKLNEAQPAASAGAQPQATVGSTPAPAVAPKTGVDATTALKAAISGVTWTWERNGRGPTNIVFETNGILHNRGWGAGGMGDKFKWRISAAYTVTLDHPELGTAKLVFDPGLTTYKGTDFRTGTPIWGKLVPGNPEGKKKDKDSSSPFGETK